MEFKYFTFSMLLWKGNVSLISLSVSLLMLYRNYIDVLECSLYPDTLLNLLISYSSILVNFWGSYMRRVILFTSIDSSTSFFFLLIFSSFHCSSYCFGNSIEQEHHHYPFLVFWGKAFSFFLLNVTLNICLAKKWLFIVKKLSILICFSFLKSRMEVWFFKDNFSMSTEMIMWFFSWFLYMWVTPFTNLYALNHSCIPEMNTICWWVINFLIIYHIIFSNIVLSTLHLCLLKRLTLSSLIWLSTFLALESGESLLSGMTLEVLIPF